MDRKHEVRRFDALGVTRGRGDGPSSGRTQLFAFVCSPRAWGWTGDWDFSVATVGVFPRAWGWIELLLEDLSIPQVFPKDVGMNRGCAVWHRDRKECSPRPVDVKVVAA